MQKKYTSFWKSTESLGNPLQALISMATYISKGVKTSRMLLHCEVCEAKLRSGHYVSRSQPAAFSIHNLASSVYEGLIGSNLEIQRRQEAGGERAGGRRGAPLFLWRKAGVGSSKPGFETVLSGSHMHVTDSKSLPEALAKDTHV